MGLFAIHNKQKFGVGDVVAVGQRIKEGEKSRLQVFEGVVIRIKGREQGKTFTVRRIGAAMVGIEKIFPLHSPLVESVTVVKKGVRGVRHAKLYYIRKKPRREISKIYSRANKKEISKKATYNKKINVRKDK